jgi:hypothetical protein
MNKGRPGTADVSAFGDFFGVKKDVIRRRNPWTAKIVIHLIFISFLYQTPSFDLPPAIAAPIAPEG